MDNIKVAVRLRPFNKRELEIGSVQVVFVNGKQVQLKAAHNKEKRKESKVFTYDCCFDSSSPDVPNFATQDNVYDGLGTDILDNVLLGYNACIFAYGQTGSGKSYTMMGSELDKGLTPRLCEHLFSRITNTSTDDLSYKVEVSYMEIYNEKVRDLLDPTGSKQNLRVREHKLLGTYVDGLSQLAVTSYKDIEAVINEGNKSRTVAATNMNSESSRSHAVFCLRVSQILTDRQSGLSGEKVSRVSLVDLAGSEKVSKTGVEGDRLKEGCNINRSLHTLGQVINALSDSTTSKNARQKHVPYRDSVLTWLLKDSIGGNSKTIMISTISPSHDNYEETLSTLRYADRAKRIVNNAVVNEDPNTKLIRDLRDEVENLKRELERAKEQMHSEEGLSDRLKESERLYNEVSKPWDEKLAETEKIQKEWNVALQSMGISVQSSGIKVENDKYYLVNLNADPSMNELLVYYLKDFTLVGRPDAKNKQDIQLQGPGIAPEHCAFYTKNNNICVAPAKDANTWVNGKLIQGETVLHHGDRIVLGINHFFRLNCPLANQSVETIEFSRAQEEVLLQNRSHHSPKSAAQEPSDTTLAASTVTDDENRSTSSIFSSTTASSSSSNDESSNGLILEMAIQRFEKEYSSLNSRQNHSIPKSVSSNSQFTDDRMMTSHSSSSSLSGSATRGKASEQHFDERFRNGLKLLREQLLRANLLVREANSLCKEMEKPIRFRVTMQIPAHNLVLLRKKDRLLSEPAILIKNKAKPVADRPVNEINIPLNKTIIDLEKFENLIIRLREIYAERQQNGQSAKEMENIESIFADNEPYYYKLIGVANIFLELLVVKDKPMSREFEYDVPIVNQQGEVSGRLRVRLQLVVERKENDEEDRTLLRLWIDRAFDLPVNLNNLVFCQYRWGVNNTKPIVVASKDSSGSEVFFDYEAELSMNGNGHDEHEDLIDYFSDGGALSIEVLAYRTDIAKPMVAGSAASNQLRSLKIYQEKMIELNQAAKMQALVDAWSKLSRSFELNVRILELNADGNWNPVEVRTNAKIKTGGVYQLRQGQSRQISVSVSQVAADSVLNYNGLLFSPEAHKIDRISMGCIVCQDTGITPLDSYQEYDLNRVRDKCRSMLEHRKQYLYAQLKQLSAAVEEQSDEERERYESLCKQLADLGDEQAAVDAPSDNSHLPGATLQWSPASGIEEHVPIVFLDLSEEDLCGHWPLDEQNRSVESDDEVGQEDEYFYDTEELDTDYSSPMSRSNRSKKRTKQQQRRRVLLVAGEENLLKFEQKPEAYLDLKLVSWNDSSAMEVRDPDAPDDLEDDEEHHKAAKASKTKQLRATARWDSSEHKSKYLNRETPLDAHVYLVVKVNVKFKLYSADWPRNNSRDIHNPNAFRYIDVVLRKRICVSVNSSLNTSSPNPGKIIGLNKLKSLLGSAASSPTTAFGIRKQSSPSSSTSLSSSGAQQSTGVAYRVIAAVPKLVAEVENRESLAIKAAAMMLEQDEKKEGSGGEEQESSELKNKLILENSMAVFEHYARTIEAVDSLLRLDRAQQLAALRKVLVDSSPTRAKSNEKDPVSNFSSPNSNSTFYVT